MTNAWLTSPNLSRCSSPESLAATPQAVHEHLERCHDCTDEYHVLRQALAALAEEEGR